MALIAGVATVRLPSPHWLPALFLTLVLACLALLCLVGWWLKATLGARDAAWAVVGTGLSLGLLAASFFLGPGPGRIAGRADVSVDLFAWAVSAAGLASALSSVGYGAVVARGEATWRLGLGSAAMVAGVLAVQPVLRALGLPHLGPVGTALLGLLVLLAVLGPGWRGRRGAQ